MREKLENTKRGVSEAKMRIVQKVKQEKAKSKNFRKVQEENFLKSI